MKARSLKQSAIPHLEGWLTIPEAAAILGCTANRVNQLKNQGKFDGRMRLVGAAAIIIEEEAVMAYKAIRESVKGKT